MARTGCEDAGAALIERRALELLEQLADIADDPAARDRLLASEPDAVVRRLTTLERHHAAAARAMPTLLPGGAPVNDALLPPSRVGSFRLVRCIGSGGMGDIWLAERADGLFDQRVAIKLIQRHALARAAAAFDEERRFLAKLEHPGVARLIDGGVSDDGLPWLATEYIEGRTIDAAGAGQSLAERVALVRAVAAVVQVAHAHLIAHGDIKPANIMVDAAGQVKLLDFGVARLIGGPDAVGSTAFTPDFASPERRQGGTVSVADDVYALGRTLAHLVADDGDRELGAVIARAVAPAAHRYADVDGLAQDLRRWAERRPVRALPASAAYRLRKFVERRRVEVLAAGVAVLLLGIALLAATHFYHRAERERAVAVAQFANAKRAAHYLMFDVEERLERKPGTLAMRAQIGRVAEEYLSRLSRLPDAPFDVKLDALEGYLRVATTMGIGNAPNLADLTRARRSLATARDLLETLAREPGHHAALVSPAVRIAALECQAQIYGEHDAARALRVARDGVSMARSLGAATTEGALLWPLRICEGDALVWLDRSTEAVRLLGRELDVARRRSTPPDRIMLARNLRFLGEALFYAGRYADAAVALNEALALLDRAHRSEPFRQTAVNEYASVADDLASTRTMQGRFADALAVSRTAYVMVRTQAALDPDDLQSQRRALSLARLVAGSLAKLGRAREAVALMNRVGTEWDALVARYPDDAALARLRNLSLSIRGDLSRAAGDRVGGCRFYSEAMAQWATFGNRWRISPSDVREVIASTRRDVAACEGTEQFLNN